MEGPSSDVSDCPQVSPPPRGPHPAMSASSLWYMAKSWVLSTKCRRCPLVCFVSCRIPVLGGGAGAGDKSCVYIQGFIEPGSSLLLSFKASELKMF